MESAEAARQFLNDVKGVFGVRGCYYLISVSEDAMSSFERRGLPFRDVFDSSFDAIQPVGYLSLEESRAVLETRVTGLPVPFQHLCHCLSGGLPRDLIRTTRELIHQQEGRPTMSLGELALAVVRAEFRGKVAAAMEAARLVPGGHSEWLAEWLSELEPMAVDAARLRDHYEGLRGCPALTLDGTDQSDPAQRVHEIAVEVSVFDYYAATVLGFFGDEPAFVASIEPLPGDIIDPLAEAAVESLAKARQQFSVNPWLAWHSLGRVREAVAWLESWPDPRSSG
jgi:hypothetical protein